jgi:hypothetical protein
MSSQMDGKRVEAPWISPARKRGLSLFMFGVSLFWFLLCGFAFITMQIAPPKPSLWNNLLVIVLGLGGSGLFGWCAVAVRRASSYVEGTTLFYRSGFWIGYRRADLARVTQARISQDKRDEGFDLRLSGNGNLKKFPLSHAGTGVLPELSREILATALGANPDKAVTAEAIATLRSSVSESANESSWT